MKKDPWENAHNLFKTDDIVTGKVYKIEHYGAFVELETGIEGLIHITQLSKDKIYNVEDVIKVGDTISARVLKIDTEFRMIALSIALV